MKYKNIIKINQDLIFSLSTGITKKLLNITKKKKKKHDKILMLAKSKLNSIETLISQALIDMDISHEEFIRILKEKDRYEMMKDNLGRENWQSYEIMKFNSVKSKIFKKNFFWYKIKGKSYQELCTIKKTKFFLV